jgi:hypothetical protein
VTTANYRDVELSRRAVPIEDSCCPPQVGLDTSPGLGFVRERLALVGKALFLVSFGFYLVGPAIVVLPLGDLLRR